MRTSTTLALAATAAAAGAFIYLSERHSLSSTERAASSHLLATAPPEETVEIQISDATGKTELRRESPAHPWRVVKPYRDRADPDAASSLFSLATSLEIVETLGSTHEVQGIDPFDASTRRITLENASGDPLVDVEFGRPAALDGTVYARDLKRRDGRINIVRSPHLATLAKPAATLRDPRLIHVGESDVTLLRIRTGGGSLTLERLAAASGSAKATWQITEPLDTAAQPGSVDEIVKAITSARVRARPENGSAATPAAFEDPTATVTVVSGTTDKTTIRLLEVAPGTVLATTSERRPIVFEVSPAVLTSLRTPPQKLRSTTLAHIDPELLSGVEVTLASSTTSLARPPGGTWTYTAGGRTAAANAERITALAETISSTPVLDFANDAPTDLAPYGLAEPAASVKLTSTPNPMDPTATTSKTLILGRGAPAPGEPPRLFATFTDRPFVYEVGPSLIAALPTDPIGWRSTQITAISAFDLESITLAQGAAPPFSLVRNPTTFRWTATRPGIDLSARLDQQRANLLATALSTFFADRWLTRRGEALQRLARSPSLVVTITFSNGEPPLVLSFAPPSDATTSPEFYLGTAAGLPEVFIVNKTTYSALVTSLLKE